MSDWHRRDVICQGRSEWLKRRQFRLSRGRWVGTVRKKHSAPRTTPALLSLWPSVTVSYCVNVKQRKNISRWVQLKLNKMITGFNRHHHSYKLSMWVPQKKRCWVSCTANSTKMHSILKHQWLFVLNLIKKSNRLLSHFKQSSWVHDQVVVYRGRVDLNTSGGLFSGATEDTSQSQE